ncbi:hypothetical protein DTO271D3_5240 [Paecilomyces variotii]|nr:hypothetical protein DTO271D3_5240 [Paecilomyces variotii]
MAKKGGKKGKGNKGKSGGGGGAAKKGVDVKNIVSPGHAVEDRVLYGDGEPSAAATQDAPEAVAAAGTTSTKVPSAAPETAAATSEQQEAVSKTQESETSQAESEEEPTTAEKTAAGGAGVAGVAGAAVAGESVKDTEAAAPVTEEVVPAETKEVAPAETTAANESLAAPATEDLSRQVPTEELESSRSTEAPLVGSAVAGGAVTAVAGTTLAERRKSKEAQGSEETAGSAAAVELSAVEPHAKRPYETSPLIQDETKPYKMPKVDDSADVAAPAKANGVLQDGMPGTYPGTPSGQDSSAAAVSALPGGNAVQSIPDSSKTANVSDIQEDYQKHTAAGTELSTAGVAAAGAPLEVPGLESGETSKDLETQPTTQTSAISATESRDTSTNGLPIAAAATGGTAPAVAAAAAAATVPEGNKESELEAQKVTEPAASPAVAVTKEEVPDFSTATATVPVETNGAEAERQPITEPAAAVTKEQAPGSVANGTPSTPIPALIASEDKSATLAPSSAAPAGPAGPGAVAAGLQSQEAAGQATTTGPVSGETKPTEDAAARDASLDGKKAGGGAPDVSQLQSTIAQAQEKAAELENKTAELEKRKKGGLFGWLKRKIKGDKA